MKDNRLKIIGLMSGTSLDGVDVALCTFDEQGGQYSFSIEKAATFPYEAEWKEKLSGLYTASAMTLASVHAGYGHYLGRIVREFCIRHEVTADYVASHGHTVFHQPGSGFTCQVGDGASIAAECGLPVISDFRTSDVALGGQGAPLVPIGDLLLFGSYDSCLNIGGFANISMEKNGQRIAFDTSPANMVLNHLAEQAGIPYDDQGKLAASGSLIPALLEALNSLDYYHSPAPKSLGREWVERHVMPLMDTGRHSIPDMLHTFVIHIAMQAGKATEEKKTGSMLITGGGAYNDFLIDSIRSQTQLQVHIPEPAIIEFKEALVFAFLGYLRIREIPNCLSSVTGARSNACGGAVYLP